MRLRTMQRIVAASTATMGVLTLFGCSSSGLSGVLDSTSSDTSYDEQYAGKRGEETIRILSGSENQELGEILKTCAEETGVTIEMTYQGSVDIMHCLQDGAEAYDAVWPASSLWISMGDTKHLVKYDTSISMSPVVFGIRESLAEELQFTDGETSIADILEAVTSEKLSFCMTSATQSNSGASAYIGFLYALLGKSEGITVEDLDDSTLQTSITNLFSGIERSSGSSDWLKEMFLEGDYDAMVNYESLIIDANETLTEQGKEPLYVVYPYDGLSIADSPLGYLNHGDADKQTAFQAVQDYLLSDSVQKEIEKTGRRIQATGVSEENASYFPEEWGVDTQRVLSPVPMPSEEVLTKALNLYQTNFRKPSLNIYCLDYSGSMEGEGCSQLQEAMAQILIQENAEKNLLQADAAEVNIVIPFDDTVRDVYQASDSSAASLEALYNSICSEEPVGGTDLYLAAEKGLSLLEQYDLSQYTPAIILMTDGASSTDNQQVFLDAYAASGLDVPIFSILFGDAVSTQLDELASVSNARVFDGRTDLISAFRSVKGYN